MSVKQTSRIIVHVNDTRYWKDIFARDRKQFEEAKGVLE